MIIIYIRISGYLPCNAFMPKVFGQLLVLLENREP